MCEFLESRRRWCRPLLKGIYEITFTRVSPNYITFWKYEGPLVTSVYHIRICSLVSCNNIWVEIRSRRTWSSHQTGTTYIISGLSTNYVQAKRTWITLRCYRVRIPTRSRLIFGDPSWFSSTSLAHCLQYHNPFSPFDHLQSSHIHS